MTTPKTKRRSLTERQKYVLALGQAAAHYKGFIFGPEGAHTGLSLANAAFKEFGLDVKLVENPKRRRGRAAP